MGKTFQRKDRNSKDWYISYKDPDGRRIKQRIGQSKKLAEAILKKIEVSIAENRYLDVRRKDKIKFEVFADEYLEVHSKVNNRSWEKSDDVSIKILKKTFSGKYLHEITPVMVEKFKAERVTQVKPSSTNKCLACLKSMFNKASAWGKFSDKNPVTQVKFFKENNQRLRFLEKEEIVTLLEKCDKHLRPIVIVALNYRRKRNLS